LVGRDGLVRKEFGQHQWGPDRQDDAEGSSGDRNPHVD